MKVRFYEAGTLNKSPPFYKEDNMPRALTPLELEELVDLAVKYGSVDLLDLVHSMKKARKVLRGCSQRPTALAIEIAHMASPPMRIFARNFTRNLR